MATDEEILLVYKNRKGLREYYGFGTEQVIELMSKARQDERDSFKCEGWEKDSYCGLRPIWCFRCTALQTNEAKQAGRKENQETQYCSKCGDFKTTYHQEAVDKIQASLKEKITSLEKEKEGLVVAIKDYQRYLDSPTCTKGHQEKIDRLEKEKAELEKDVNMYRHKVKMYDMNGVDGKLLKENTRLREALEKIRNKACVVDKQTNIEIYLIAKQALSEKEAKS